MIISKLNRFTDRHGKAAIIVIALMIVIPFVFMWGPNSVFDRSGEKRLTHAGELYGKKVPITDLMLHVRFAQLEMMQTQRRPLDLSEKGASEFILNQALQRMQALHEAKQRGLDVVSDEQIDDVIRRSFNVDGRFDRDQYVFFRDAVLRSLGLGESEFREFIRQDIILSRIYGEVLADVFVTPLEVDEQLRKNHQEFRVGYRAFRQSDYLAEAEAALVSEDAVDEAMAALKQANPDQADSITRDAAVAEVLDSLAADFFRAQIEPLRPWIDGTFGLDDVAENYAAAYAADTDAAGKPTPVSPEEFTLRLNRLVRPLYQSPTKRLVVVRIPVAAFTDKVGEISDKEVRAKYEEDKESYEKRVRARHILIRVEDDADDEAVATAREKIEDIHEQLQADGDFAALAKQYSEDPGSAVRGGELGTFGRGRMVKPFEEAAFALDEGQISDVVTTDFGFHIIKVDKVIPEKSFADVRFDLVAELSREKARKFAWEAAEELSYKVFDQADRWQKKAFQVLAQMATENKYEVKTTDFFSPDGDYPELFGDSRAAVRKAYGVTENQPLSDAVEGENAYFVAALVEARPGSLTELDADAVAFCLTVILQDQALELARTAAESVREEVVANLPESETLAFLEKTYDFQAPEPFTRLNPPSRDQVGWTVLGQLSEQSVGTLSDPLDLTDGAVLVYIDERLPLDAGALSDDDREVAREQVRRQKIQVVLQVFHQRLEAEANPELIEGLADMLAR